MPNFTPTTCSHCGQSKEYLLGLDRGSARIVIESDFKAFINCKNLKEWDKENDFFKGNR